MSVDLPSPPVGLAMVIRAASDPEATVRDLASLVSKEPGLTTALLKLANSAAYGVSREVRTVQQAAVLLGSRAIRNIAVSHAVRVTTSGIDTGDLDASLFWEDSLRRAVASMCLARHAGYEDPSEAFTLGLLQDVGVLLMAVRWRDRSAGLQAATRVAGPERLAKERELTGLTHPEMFARAAPDWGLPQDMVDVVAVHHDDQARLEDRRSQRLLEIVRVGDALADLVQTKLAAGSAQRAQDLLGALASREPLELEAIMEEIGAELEQASRDLEIGIREQPSFRELMSDANEALIQLNVSYEELTRKLQQALAEKEALAKELEKKNEQLRRLAATDVLTGAMNRRAFTQALEHHRKALATSGRPLSLVMLDIDHFKKVNDTYGHASGDDVLKTVARRLSSVLRAGDLLGRLGGEEFAVILPACDQANGLVVAERLRQVLRREPVVDRDGTAIPVTSSFGGTTVHGPTPPSADDILRVADERLYDSKRGGRDRVTWSG